ncbi:MAG: hypothetical protein SGARI_000153, partial [Bacillariaceae sp.]
MAILLLMLLLQLDNAVQTAHRSSVVMVLWILVNSVTLVILLVLLVVPLGVSLLNVEMDISVLMKSVIFQFLQVFHAHLAALNQSVEMEKQMEMKNVILATLPQIPLSVLMIVHC